MGLKFKISLLHICVSFVTIFFIYMIYESYIIREQKEVKRQLEKLMKFNGVYLNEAIDGLKKTLLKRKKIAVLLHKKIHEELKKNPTIDIDELKKSIIQEYKLEQTNESIDIFLIKKNLNIKDMTYKSIFEFKFSENAKKSIRDLKKIDDYIYMEEFYANIIDQKVKSFSYSNLNENYYLGTNFIVYDIKKHKDVLYDMLEVLDGNLDFFYVMSHDNKNEFYESVVSNRKTLPFTKEYLKTKKMFPINEPSNDFIIKTSRQWESFRNKKGDFLHIYIPILNKNNPMIVIPGDIILKIDLDISEQNLFFNSIINKLILFVFMHFILIFLIFYFTNKYQKIEERLKKEIKTNDKLVEYNKSFISNLVHQIRTPLAIIMTNISLLEILIPKNISTYTRAINSSISMLSNSYENLSYFVSFKTLNYPKRQIELASFIKDRISFFDYTSSINKKSIIFNIKKDVYYEINDIEFERIVDNTIFNALDFCLESGTIFISLKELDKGKKRLIFRVLDSNNNDITILEEKEKNYMKNMSSFGLGLYLMRKISKKNSINCRFDKKDDEIHFDYLLT